jgi:TonB family protein
MMISLLWKSAVVLAGAWAAAWLLRRRPAATVHAAWMAGFVVLALLPAGMRLLPPLEPPVVGLRLVVDAVAPAGGVPALSAPKVAAWIWLAGAMLSAARLAAGHARAARLVRNAAGQGPVRESDQAAVPFTWGLLRPVVLLPASSRHWPEAQRASVLRHELAHVARGDLWWLLLTQALCCVYWFQPLAWLAARRATQAMERACDDRALEGGWAPPDYAAHLLALARLTLDARLPVAAASGRSELDARVRAILDPCAARGRAGRITLALAALAAVALLLPVAALRGQAQEPSPVGDDVKPPVLVFKFEPEYTQEARDARIEGTVVLGVVVDVDGRASEIEVARSLDAGLDRNAVEAVRKWRWKPGTKEGKPVRVNATIQVNFKLM